MANFSSAFGFRVFLVPMKSTAVTNSVDGGIDADASAFIDITSITADSAEVTEPSAEEIAVDGSDVVAGAATVFELLGLTDAALETNTKSEEVVTYGDGGGYAAGIATSKSWKISLEGVTDFNSAAYQMLRLAEKNNVAGGIRVKVGRTTPSGEAVYGYATLKSYKEKSKAGSIVSYSVDCEGYGELGLTLA